MSERSETNEAELDVLVIGGGITGCAAARDAAARGLAVVLVEQDDLAAGTSSRSTKLLHGGLRYLEHGHLRLVREALRERETTARLAPALALPLRFCMPVRPGTFPGRLAARLGVGLYDWLAPRHPLAPGRRVDREEIYRLAPELGDGWIGGVAFMDRQTDDARLTVAIARDAKRRGASIELGCQVTSVERRGGTFRVVCRDEHGRSTKHVVRCVVNAGGPWCDRVRALAGERRPMLRTSRGAHLVLAGLALDTALILPGVIPGHRVFAIPWRDVTLFGTTDVVDPGDPGALRPAVLDIRVLFDLARKLFPRAELTRRHVLSSFAGMRPLLDQRGDTLASSREHTVVDEDGFVTIAGGKLTTWRTMAVSAIDAVVRRLGRGGPSPRVLAEEPLPGGDSAHPDLDAVLADEMVRHADDVVFRRLPIGHDPQRVRRELPAILQRMSVALGWDPARRQDESARVFRLLEADAARLDEALGSSSG